MASSRLVQAVSIDPDSNNSEDPRRLFSQYSLAFKHQDLSLIPRTHKKQQQQYLDLENN